MVEMTDSRFRIFCENQKHHEMLGRVKFSIGLSAVCYVLRNGDVWITQLFSIGNIRRQIFCHGGDLPFELFVKPLFFEGYPRNSSCCRNSGLC